MRRLFAGPFVGEFGWELFCWQAYLRTIAKPFYEIVVATRPGRHLLYRDFATRVIECETDRVGHDDRSQFVGAFPRYVVPEDYEVLLPDEWLYQGKPVEIPGFGLVKPTFREYAKRWPCQYEFIIWPLDDRQRPERNWPLEHWTELVSKLRGNVGAVGTYDESIVVNGADDLRYNAVKQTIAKISNAKTVIGPASGLINLAALCGAKRIITWSGEPEDENRFKFDWNPFFAEVEFIPTWQPTVEQVLSVVTSG